MSSEMLNSKFPPIVFFIAYWYILVNRLPSWFVSNDIGTVLIVPWIIGFLPLNFFLIVFTIIRSTNYLRFVKSKYPVYKFRTLRKKTIGYGTGTDYIGAVSYIRVFSKYSM